MSTTSLCKHTGFASLVDIIMNRDKELVSVRKFAQKGTGAEHSLNILLSEASGT